MKLAVEKVRIKGVAGETVIDCNSGEVTVSGVVPLMPSKVAVIVEVPAARA